MEESLVLVAVMLCILVAAAISRRIQGTILTLPMVYVALGFLLSERVLGIIHVSPENELVRLIAELTLILVLASDASRIDLRTLVHDHSLPLRLLSLGLPLTMAVIKLVLESSEDSRWLVDLVGGAGEVSDSPELGSAD
jgi:hypothetical protein